MFDGAFSIWHIGLVVLVAVVLFYKGDKLPDAARSVGRSLRVFKTEIKGIADDDKARDEARESSRPETHDGTRNDPASGGVDFSKTEPARPAIEAPSSPAPRVVAEPSAAIPVRAEIIREPAAAGTDSRPRPRPRPAGSSTTR